MSLQLCRCTLYFQWPKCCRLMLFARFLVCILLPSYPPQCHSRTATSPQASPPAAASISQPSLLPQLAALGSPKTNTLMQIRYCKGIYSLVSHSPLRPEQILTSRQVPMAAGCQRAAEKAVPPAAQFSCAGTWKARQAGKRAR